MTSAAHRLSEPMPVESRRTWRWRSLELTHDKTRHGGWRLGIGERYRVVEFSGLKLSLELLQFKDNNYFTLVVFGFYIKLMLSFLRTQREVKDDILDKWGFSTLDSSIHWAWGGKAKIIYLPWDFAHVDAEHKVLMADETWVTMPRGGMTDGRYVSPDTLLAAIGPRWSQAYPYRYMRNSGEVQERQATVTVERRRWRRKALPAWLNLFQKRRTYIDVAFSDEVGEGTGSWKGGTTGCSYEMRPGDRPIDTLRRMEHERRFSR